MQFVPPLRHLFNITNENITSYTVMYAQKHSTIHHHWRDIYSHKELKFKCDDCDQRFAFESNLQRHRISHRTLLTHCCVYLNCNKKFKNKGDLTCHAKEHDGIMHKCADCSYENPDVRNLESHRLMHSAIEKYACKLCGKTFRFSNQCRRHVNDKKCPKRSASPEH